MESIFLKLIGDFGIIPVMIGLIMVVWFLLREIKKEVGGVGSSVKGIKGDLEQVRLDLISRIQELKERSDEKDSELRRAMDEIEKRMLALEKDSVSKEQMYRLISGWRAEITNLNSLILDFGEKNGKEK